MSSESYTYKGAWINWSQGRFLGATITLSSRNGAFLLAVAALFVALSGSRCWRILAFIYHQSMVRHEPRDGMHHQHRVILRSSSSGGALFELLVVAYSWRSKARLPFARSVPLILLAILNFFGFIVAGVFSSQVPTAVGDEVLIRGPNCGFWSLKKLTTNAELRSYMAFRHNQTLVAANYARFCYDDSVNESAFCVNSALPTRRIEWTANKNGDCPFSAGVCINTTRSYNLDTGHIDSHDVLGMNAKPTDRVTFRKVISCAVLNDDPFIRYVNATEGDGRSPGQTYLRLNYGPAYGLDYTYEFGMRVRGGSGDYGYSLRYSHPRLTRVLSYTDPSSTETFVVGMTGNQRWEPISNLSRTDADVNLLFLAPNVLSYEEPNNDPYFSATVLSILPFDDGYGSNLTIYYSDRNVSTIGCTEQYQFCNPNLPEETGCTSLTGQYASFLEIPYLDLNNAQFDTAMRLGDLTYRTSLGSVVGNRGAAALRAQDTVYGNTQGKLPDDQWTKEVRAWFATGLASLQLGIVEHATGPTSTDYIAVVQRDGLLDLGEVCRSQKVSRRDASISFSILGLSIIFAIGGTIIVTSYVLEPLTGWIGKLLGSGEYQYGEWLLDEKLQLQRLACEGAGRGNWESHLGSIPVTRKGDLF